MADPTRASRLVLVCERCDYARQIAERVPWQRTYYCPPCNRAGFIHALVEMEVRPAAIAG